MIKNLNENRKNFYYKIIKFIKNLFFSFIKKQNKNSNIKFNNKFLFYKIIFKNIIKFINLINYILNIN